MLKSLKSRFGTGPRLDQLGVPHCIILKTLDFEKLYWSIIRRVGVVPEDEDFNNEGYVKSNGNRIWCTCTPYQPRVRDLHSIV